MNSELRNDNICDHIMQQEEDGEQQQRDKGVEGS
jgi:hypothetical protein